MSTFRIVSLGDGLGDCFLVEISNDKSSINILIDGHRKLFNDLGEYIKDISEIDYMVITHIDADHIKGIIELLENKALKDKFKDTKIIYNYVSQPYINYKHAEKIEKMILDRKVIHTCNDHYFEESNSFLKILAHKKRKDFKPPNDDCAYLTLLHPNQKSEVNEVYYDYYKKTNAGRYQPDSKLINKHSIAIMIEFNNQRVLFTGDSSIEILMNKIDELKDIDGSKIDLIKIPHHGAENENYGLVDFSIKYKCNKFLVTGEKKWNQKHPNEKLLAKLNEMNQYIEIYTKIQELPKLKYIEYKNESEIDFD